MIYVPPAAATKQKRLQSKIIVWCKQSQDGKQSAAKLVKEFLDTSPQRHVNALCFTHETLKRVFIKTNTAVPSMMQLKKYFRLEKTFQSQKDRA